MFGIFHRILQKSLNELSGQPNKTFSDCHLSSFLFTYLRRDVLSLNVTVTRMGKYTLSYLLDDDQNEQLGECVHPFQAPMPTILRYYASFLPVECLQASLVSTHPEWCPAGSLGNKPCCCSVSKSRLTLCDPVGSSVPSSSVLHCLPDSAQIHAQ